MNTDYVLDVKKGIVQNGSNIQLYHYNGTKAQRWFLEPAGNGYFYIQSALNPEYVIDLENGSIVNGQNIILYRNKGGKNQRWKINK